MAAVWLTIVLVTAIRRNRPWAWLLYLVMLLVAAFVLNAFLVLLIAVHAAALAVLSPRRRAVACVGGDDRRRRGPGGTVLIFSRTEVRTGGVDLAAESETPSSRSCRTNTSTAVRRSRSSVGIIVAVALRTAPLRRHPAQDGHRALAVVAIAWIACPPIALLLYTAFAAPIYYPRYLCFTAPAMALLLGVCHRRDRPHPGRAARRTARTHGRGGTELRSGATRLRTNERGWTTARSPTSSPTTPRRATACCWTTPRHGSPAPSVRCSRPAPRHIETSSIWAAADRPPPPTNCGTGSFPSGPSRTGCAAARCCGPSPSTTGRLPAHADGHRAGTGPPARRGTRLPNPAPDGLPHRRAVAVQLRPDHQVDPMDGPRPVAEWSRAAILAADRTGEPRDPWPTARRCWRISPPP